MLEDLKNGAHLNPSKPEVAAAEALVRERKPTFFSYEDWLKLDEMEVAKGEKRGCPRVKFTSVEEMLKAVVKT
jgi:ferredoxin--NADP+ reductase